MASSMELELVDCLVRHGAEHEIERLVGLYRWTSLVDMANSFETELEAAQAAPGTLLGAAWREAEEAAQRAARAWVSSRREGAPSLSGTRRPGP